MLINGYNGAGDLLFSVKLYGHHDYVKSITGVSNLLYVGMFVFSGVVFLGDALLRTRKQKSKRN